MYVIGLESLVTKILTVFLEIKLAWKSLKGTIDLSWMPPTVTYFSVGDNRMAGTLENSRFTSKFNVSLSL